MQTDDPDVFALGDCAEIDGAVMPYVLPILHGSRALAKTLSGKPSPAQFPPMPVTVKTPAHPLCILPPPKECQGEWETQSEAEGTTAIFKDEEGLVKGFALSGKAIEKSPELVHKMKTTTQPTSIT